MLNYLFKNHDTVNPDSVADSLAETFKFVKKLATEAGIAEPVYLNMVVTNGLFIVATRYVTDPKADALTLYHSEGTRYVVENGQGRLVAPEDDDNAVLVVSEKLSDGPEWTLIPRNHVVKVEPNLNVRVSPINA
jgi:predicted glutamine amidotransferase